MASSCSTNARLCMKKILSSCPVNPRRSDLPLPCCVTVSHDDIFVTSAMEDEELAESESSTQLVDDFLLLSPMLYAVFSPEDLNIMKSPIAIPQPRRPVNTGGSNVGDRQTNSNQHHSYNRGGNKGATYGDSSDFVTQRGNGRRFQGQHRSTYQHSHGNKSNGDGYNNGRHTYNHHHRNHYHQHGDGRNQQPKKSIDSFVSQFESMAPYKPRDVDASSMEDPWADTSSSVGSFDSSGNFITLELPKKEPISSRPSKIPIQQSRLSSIISSKIITAESLEATLFQNSTSSEGESSVEIPFFNLWYYKDPYGNIQGPFPSEQMAHWSDAGYFDLKMLVRPDVESASTFNSLNNLSIISDFVPLSEWISLYNRNWPWSNQAKNIVYSVKQSQSSKQAPVVPEESTASQDTKVHSNVQKPDSIIQNTEAETLKPSIAESVVLLKNDTILLQSDITAIIPKSHEQKTTDSATIVEPIQNTTTAPKFKGWAIPSKATEPVANIGASLQENSQNRRLPESQPNQKMEATSISVKPKPISWSSVAGSGVSSQTEPVEVKSTPSKIGTTNNSTTAIASSLPQSKPSQPAKMGAQDEKSNLTTSLGKWVSKELSRMHIKNIDPTTLTNLLLPLSADQMRDILTEFLSTTPEINGFIDGFIQVRLDSTQHLNGGDSSASAPTKKKNGASFQSNANENDGFSVIVRKPKKPSSASKPISSTQEIPVKRIVGL